MNESGTPVFLGSAAPPKDLAIESLTLSENAELLVPEVFGQTPVATKVAPGGVVALTRGLVIIAATSTEKVSSRHAALVSFVGNGTEGRVLLVGTADTLGRAAVRDVDGQLTVVPLDANVTVHPIRQNAKPACNDLDTKKTLDWTNRIGKGTIATQTWSDGCVEITFVDDKVPFRACLPQDAWPFQENRAIDVMPFANQEGLAHTNGSGERGVRISDGETTLELEIVKAPLSWAPPIDGTSRLHVEARKDCLTVEPFCARVTTPINVTLLAESEKRTLEIGVPFERILDGQRVTRRIVGGRVTPVRRLACEGEASGYSMEVVTLRRPQQ